MATRLEHLTQLLESSPQDAFLLFALAKEYESAGDDQHALAFYLRLQETDPSYTGLYYHLGKLWERENDFGNAIATYKQGIEICRQAGDQHSLSELQAALFNFEDPE